MIDVGPGPVCRPGAYPPGMIVRCAAGASPLSGMEPGDVDRTQTVPRIHTSGFSWTPGREERVAGLLG